MIGQINSIANSRNAHRSVLLGHLAAWVDLRLADDLYDAILPARRSGRGFLTTLSRSAPAIVTLTNLLAVVLVSFAPPLIVRRISKFQRLDPAEQRRCAIRLQAHRFYLPRLVFSVVKLAAGMRAFRSGPVQSP